MYAWLLVLHILAAVAVIGTAFFMPIVRRSASTAAQLRFVFHATTAVAWCSKIGAAVLVLTGIWLMIIADTGFSQMWLNLSILLSLILAATIGGFIEPRVKRLKQMASESQGSEFSADVGLAMRKLVPWETTAQLLALVVTVLMVVKPL